MNYLKKGFSRSFKGIKNHKRLFVLISFLQLILLVSVIAASIYFQVKIFADAHGIIEPLQNANYDANSIQEGAPFTKDMVDIYKNYQSMKHNVIVFVSLLLMLYVILDGGIWVLSQGLLGNINLKNYKDISHNWLKLLVSLLLILGPFLIISYFLLISVLKAEAVDSFSGTVDFLMYLLFGLYYIILAAFALSYKRSWRKFADVVYETSIKNILRSLSVLLINLALLSILGYFVYYTVIYNESFFLLTLSSILFIIGLVVTRIFWIASLRQIEERDR